MSHYNPHEPIVIGNEYVPIHGGQVQPDTLTERGTTFRLDTSQTIVSGAVYMPVQYPLWNVRQNYVGMQVYPKGLENETGPIEQLIYPVTGGTITGDMQIAGASAGCTTIAQALSGDSECGIIDTMTDPPAESGDLDINFTVNANGELDGKRILKVEILYSMILTPVLDFESLTYPGSWQFHSASKTFTIISGTDTLDNADPNFGVVDLGEGNWDFPEDTSPPQLFPWTPAQMRRFDPAAAAGTRMDIRWHMGDLAFLLKWVVMRVTFCQERRLAVGGTWIRSANTPGPKYVMLKATPWLTGNAVLPVGEYTVTANAWNTGDREDQQTNGAGRIAFTRQLYEIPDHQGILVRRSFNPGEPFTREVVPELPQLSLYTSTAALTGVHGYGAQQPAKVYEGTVAATDVRNPVIQGLSTPVPTTQVRFYARKTAETSKTLLLLPSGGNTPFALIDPADFDALPEIWSGWKEVTLRLNTTNPFQVTGGWQVWQWSASGEDVGRAWEILGVTADTAYPQALPSSAALTNTGQTYGGSTIRFWHGFWDSWADSSIIFSTDPPTPTGFDLVELEQALTAIDDSCPGVDSTCIPTSLRYHRLTWQPTGLIDAFSRTASDTWGTAESGQAWSITAGTAADFDVAGGYGTVALPTADVSHFVVSSDISYNVDIRTKLRFNQIPTGAALRMGVIFRYVDTNNYYEARVTVNTDSSCQIGIFKVIAGTATFIGGSSDLTVDLLGFVQNTDYDVHVRTEGTSVYMSIWRESRQSEPVNWQLVVVDNTPPWSGRSGFRMRTAPSNTSVGMIVSVGEVEIDDLDAGGYELQRQDDVDTDWLPIMRTSSSFTGTFNDYEARVGVQSRYRLRKANMLDFWSSWTATESNTLSAPGVDVPGDGNSVLMFTTNYQQAGLQNLAYTMTWSRDVSEPFSFVEAGEVGFSKLYGRDYQLAAHPTERGGEQFTRIILVQQAAIPLPSLGNFRDLRDMAWAYAPYVCVRDELGNRWLASVVVPDGVVSRNRRLYVASVTITEVTATPAIIDPED